MRGGIILDIDQLSPQAEVALRGIATNHPGFWGVKIGDRVERTGLNVLSRFHKFKVFLDLKRGDTADRMSRIAALYGKEMGACAPTLFSVSGECTDRALAEGLAHCGSMELVMTTVLSDNTEEDCFLDSNMGLATKLYHRAQKAKRCALSAVTCPAHLLPHLKWKPKTVVTTGVRSKGTEAHNHVLPLPLEEALQLGATHIVVGREVTQSSDPIAKLHELASRYCNSKHALVA